MVAPSRPYIGNCRPEGKAPQTPARDERPHAIRQSTVMILLRHGQSEFNVAYNATRVDPGIPDPCLTEEGRRQALAAGTVLARHRVERLIASPYTRALETAEIVA